MMIYLNFWFFVLWIFSLYFVGLGLFFLITVAELLPFCYLNHFQEGITLASVEVIDFDVLGDNNIQFSSVSFANLYN